MAGLKLLQVLFILCALHSCIVYGQETEDVTEDSDTDFTEEEKESSDDEPEPEVTVEKTDDAGDSSTELCSLPDLDNLVDQLMANVNKRIPITRELANRELRTMTISDISVSNLNSMVRYRASAISCPGEGKVYLTIPLRSMRPIISLFRWDLYFPRGIGGRVTMSIADFDADAVVSIERDPEQGIVAKLLDLKLMRLDGISIQTSGYGGLIGRISDTLTTLLVSNFRGLFRNFVQKELSKIIADEMVQIPFGGPKGT